MAIVVGLTMLISFINLKTEGEMTTHTQTDKQTGTDASGNGKCVAKEEAEMCRVLKQ